MRVIMVILFCLSACVAGAQDWKQEHDINKPVADIQKEGGTILQVRQAPQNVGRVQGVVGQVYNENQINALGTRSVNRIAGMTMGVESRSGAEPVFKATPGGTAYFVDGIRIRSGALCIPGMSF